MMRGHFKFISRIWDRLHSSFWFLPSVMAIFAMATAIVLILLDTLEASRLGWIDEWTYAFGPESARDPVGYRGVHDHCRRRHILDDNADPAIGIFTIWPPNAAQFHAGSRQSDCAWNVPLHLRLLPVGPCFRSGSGNSYFVPLIAVMFGMILAVASLATLIYFIHHITTSIRIETILADLAAEACKTVERVFPEPVHTSAPFPETLMAEALPPDFDDDSRSVVASGSGYIQSIDLDRILQVASDNDLVVRVGGRIGNFVPNTGSLVVASPYGRVSDAVADDLRNAFSFGQERTPEYDIEFSLRRIV